MEHRLLGRSGCAVSTLALGTMTFGTESDENGSRAQLDAYVTSGGNLIDTADVYSDGASEEIVGRWLATAAPDVRDRVVIATKGRFPTGRTRTTSAFLAGTCSVPWTSRCVDSESTASISTRCTHGIH